MIKGKERHDFAYKLAINLLRPFLCLRFNYKYDRIDVPHSQYIVISNHLTNWDPLLIGLSFKKSMYYIASDYLFRVGLKGKIVKFLFSPIARAKSMLETSAVIKLFRRLKEKCNICIFAEGNTSFDGETGEVQRSISKLIKRAGVALVTYRFKGVYFSYPRWSRFMRRGKAEGRLVQIYSPEKLAAMSEDEIFEAVKADIYANAYEDQEKNPVAFKSKRPAEYLETALYCCPKCRQFSTLTSKRSRLFCKCGFQVRLNEYGYFELPGKNGQTPPFTTILDWSRWQRNQIIALAERMINLDDNAPIFTDPDQKLYLIKRASHNIFHAKGSLYLYNNRISFIKKNSETIEFPFETIMDLSFIARMIIIFSTNDGKLYEIHSKHPRSAIKYLEMIKALKSLKSAEIT